MTFCDYTNFDALFPSVVLDCLFLRLNQHFEIATFVYCSSSFTKMVIFKRLKSRFSICGNFIPPFLVLDEHYKVCLPFLLLALQNYWTLIGGEEYIYFINCTAVQLLILPNKQKGGQLLQYEENCSRGT